MERTNNNGELGLKDVGKKVVLVGWCSKKRNLGGLQFIDLRDRSGIVQIIVREGIKIPDIRNEYVLQVFGTIGKKEVANPNLKTGAIEVIAEQIIVINKAETTPLIIDDKTDALEDVRLKYRYLDLRRPCMQDYLIKRAKIIRATHEYLDNNGYIEVETPILMLSSPEGARDYLVPSRLHHGSFYALPQSPQLFKQLLMIGGMERYYQIARCFRDEDLRADRQPEFTQIDVEMSFMDQDQVLTMMEGLLQKIFKETINVDIKLPLRRMEYDEAVDKYGSDKPDTRFEIYLHDITSIVKGAEFKAFSSKYVRAIIIHNKAKETSRKTVDELSLEMKKFSLPGIIALKYIDNKLEGSVLKYVNEDIQSNIIKELSLKEDDLLLIACGDNRHDVSFGLGALRNKYARELGLIKPNTYDILWVVHWPLFNLDKETGKYTSEHHPFTRPCEEDMKYLDSDPLKVYSQAYDIIINGYEAGGGTLRIHEHDIQAKIFKILALSDEDVKRKFGYFIDAFKYGTPPHAGIAFGLDRLSMIICGTDNIRDVIAFPKNLAAVDPMSGAPTTVDPTQLDELGIEIKK
jgi:aspartyl-tRNA synthetase